MATPIKSDNNTALHYFCQCALLLRVPVAELCSTRYYKSPLDVDELFQMFIKLGADVNARNNNNETPIFKAIWNTSIKLYASSSPFAWTLPALTGPEGCSSRSCSSAEPR